MGRDSTPAKRRITLRDVAERAGVSSATASRVLNGSEREVGEDVRHRVVAAARAVGYARALPVSGRATSASRTVVLVLGSVAGTYFATLASAVIREARALGLVVSIQVTDREHAREVLVARELVRMRPRAVIFAGSGRGDAESSAELVAELSAYERAGGRVLLLGRDDLPFAAVSFDNHEGAKRLGAELSGLGYRRALVLGSAVPLVGVFSRADGFASGFLGEGAEVQVRPILLTWDAAKEAVLALTDDELRGYDVIFGVTDEIALGALAAVRSRGLRVPSDIGIAGFNDIITLRDVEPPLTTVHVPLELVAAEVMALAVSEGERATRNVEIFPVLRDSTAPRRAGNIPGDSP